MSTKTFWMIILLALFVAALAVSACGTDGSSRPTGASAVFDMDGATTMALGPSSTVRAGQPSFVLGGCFAVADFTFREAIEALTSECEEVKPEADTLLVTMCFPSEPPDAAGLQASCPVCDLSTEWALGCSELSFGAP